MRLSLASVAVLAFASIAAHADTVTFTLLNPTQTSTTSGSTLLFNASVFAPSTNTGSEDLQSIVVNVNPTNSFTVDYSAFFNTYPFSLAPGQSYSGLLFTLLAPAGTTANTYTGSAVLYGGPSSSQLGTQNFTVNVTPAVAVTPEPSSLLMLGTGVIAMATTFRRRFMAFSN